MFGADALDRAARVKRSIKLSPPGAVVDRRKPVAADLDRPAGLEERRAVEPLFAEMLFGKCHLVLQFCRFGKPADQMAAAVLVGRFQIAYVPDRVAGRIFPPPRIPRSLVSGRCPRP